MISFGAHPNYLGVEPNVRFEWIEGTINGRMSFNYLSTHEDRLTSWYLATVTADVVIRIFAHVFKDQRALARVPKIMMTLSLELLGLMDEIKKTLPPDVDMQPGQ